MVAETFGIGYLELPSNVRVFPHRVFLIFDIIMKLKTVKIVWFEISTSNSEWVILTRGSGDEIMALYRHFQPLDNLPDPSGQARHIEVSKVRVTRGSQQRTIWQVHT